MSAWHRGRSVERRVGSQPRVRAASEHRAPSPRASISGSGLFTQEEMNSFDILQMGIGGGIRIHEIVSPPLLHKIGSGGAVVSEESELYGYRGGRTPYSSKTPVLVRIEGNNIHILTCHNQRHLISLPFTEIKKSVVWEQHNPQQSGIRLFCGAVAPTEVSLILNKGKRNALHKLVQLRTRGVVIPTKEAREASPTPVTTYQRVASISGSSSPVVAGGTGGGASAGPFRSHHQHHVSSYSHALGDGGGGGGGDGGGGSSVKSDEELDRKQRRERIRQQLQQRRLEKQHNPSPAGTVSPSLPDFPSHEIPPPPPIHSEHNHYEDTHQEARRIADDRRSERQALYERKLQDERQQRFLRRQQQDLGQ